MITFHLNGSDPSPSAVMKHIVSAIIGPTEDRVLLDLMCSKGSITNLFNWRESFHIDVQDQYPPVSPRTQGQFDGVPVVLLNDIYNKPGQHFICAPWHHIFKQGVLRMFDVALCFDGIEHVSKDEGAVMIDLVSFYSHTCVFFTPTIDRDIAGSDNHPDAHNSLWLPDDPAIRQWNKLHLPNFHGPDQGALFFWKGGWNEGYVAAKLGEFKETHGL